MAVFLSRMQSHTPTNHLYEEITRFGGACEQYAVDVWNVGSFCKYSAIHQHWEFSPAKSIKTRTSLGLWSITRDELRFYAVVSKRIGQSRNMS
jgi:hypothetical protein